MKGQEVRNDFGIGFGFKVIPIVLQLLPEGQIIFNDAIVNNDHIPRSMWMGVLFGGFSMGRPPCVSNTDMANQVVMLEGLFEVDELSHTPTHFDLSMLEHRNPR
jgi:hypothetical protein